MTFCVFGSTLYPQIRNFKTQQPSYYNNRHGEVLPVCRLTQLPALPWLPHLEALHLQDNELTVLAPLHGLQSLRLMNLSFNRLEGLRVLAALLPLTALRSLQLNDNPVASMAGYRECVQVRRVLTSVGFGCRIEPCGSQALC